MEEKGTAITIETEKKEEDLKALIITKEEDEDMEVDTQPTISVTKLPAYVPLRKGKAKVPKDLDETKSLLQTPLLPDGIMLEGRHLGCVSSMKFEYWDLANREKFPHLETKNLMKHNHGGGNNIRATEVVAQCGKGQSTEATMDAAFPSCPNNHFRHQADALPSA